MKAERLAELKAMCEAATPGPWEMHGGMGPRMDLDAADQPAYVKRGKKPGPIMTGRADAEFIAASREALPELIAEVARLQAYHHIQRDALLEAIAEQAQDDVTTGDGHSDRLLALLDRLNGSGEP